MTDKTITKSIILDCSRDTVWAFLTNKDKLGQWFFTAENDLAENQEYSLFKTDDDGNKNTMCWGKVLEMNKPSVLVYSFTIAPLSGHMTTVKWVLEDCFDGTKLSLTHEDIGAAGDIAKGMLIALDAGWDKHLLGLRRAVA